MTTTPFTTHGATRRHPVLAAILLLCATLITPVAHAGEVLVFAASSLTNALAAVGDAYEAQSDNTVAFSFASSSTIARQIAQGAPADIYVSANVEWMDYLQKRGAIQAESRASLLANQLALVAPKASPVDHVDIRPGFDLDKLLGNRFLAMGNPGHVPAGIYGKQALKSLHVWTSVQGQIARSADVRAALALVARGEAPLGIVYRTDALAADGVKIVGLFPADSHEPIIYPAALTTAFGAHDAAARDFYAFLDSNQAGRILASYGFKVLD